MSEYKYPYCPKEYYPALMYACKLVRNYGINNAIKTASRKYNVDAKALERHFRARQGAGQKGSTRKYHYYKIAYHYCDPDWYNDKLYEATVKATTEGNAIAQIWRSHGADPNCSVFTQSIEEIEYE